LSARAIPAIYCHGSPSPVSRPGNFQGIDMTPIRFAATTRRLRLFAPAGLIALALATTSALAQTPAATPDAGAPAAATAPLDQLMAPGPLPDIVQGSPTAPITIIEYASMTCSHCAAFHEETWPALKAKYIDSGKAKFILREFPFDPLAAAAFMLARCAGPDKRNAFVDQLFAQQKTWAFVDKPIEPLRAVVERAGMSQADFDACLQNQQLFDLVKQSQQLATQRLNIDSTPTFFVNGQKMVGELAIADFDNVLGPLLK
jgi:protein-disulfide isomerase